MASRGGGGGGRPTSKAARLIYSHRRAFQDDAEDPQRPSQADRAQPGALKRRRKKHLPRTHRTLAVVLESLRDEVVGIELKNETEVSGRLYDVDANLNVNLVDVEFTARNGRTSRLETMYVNGSTIRYVRLPDHVDALRALDRYLDMRARISRSQTRQKRAEPASLERPAAPPPIELPAPPRSD